MKLRAIKRIVVHCSATENGKPVTAEEIDSWHAKRGFRRDPSLVRPGELAHIGYHFVIELDGTVRVGRGLNEIGAHVEGHNADSVGICMVGGVNPSGRNSFEQGVGRYTVAQWRALERLVRDLRVKVGGASLCGHRDLSPDANHDGKVDKYEWLKTCPGFDVLLWQANGLQPLPAHILGV